MFRFGYAEFATTKEANKALKVLNGLELNGREIRVDNASTKGGGGGGGGGGGWGGRGGGGGFSRGTPRGRGMIDVSTVCLYVVVFTIQ